MPDFALAGCRRLLLKALGFSMCQCITDEHWTIAKCDAGPSYPPETLPGNPSFWSPVGGTSILGDFDTEEPRDLEKANRRGVFPAIGAAKYTFLTVVTQGTWI